ncbi:NAD(P)-dependent oxidoreductase [Alicyclobacillus vulcanalis]|uniref:3-hydroxyisobutyrate dehydrogenase n=1 Tax=Alicyclobacillus vulcanalis TaxID=252246 RepID=A0A1N7NGS0_9BACL|nr:NAD(P)-dependent oxidoreductase [Alicyclobacillus vulcanalis]SIS97379.1 3-hydroxyisobutyrate dehydrogenase [Alicyclobacillus vulcanalis]
MNIGFVGFGEAASAIAAGLRQAGAGDMMAYDAAPVEAWKSRAERLGVVPAESLADVAAACDVIFSLVTAQAAVPVAQEAAPHLRENALYADFNSCSPSVKRAVGDIVKGVRPSVRYAAVAVMSAVKPLGHRVPLVVDGDGASALAALLRPYGCQVEVLQGEVGGAALLKMCRSAVLKGLEALFLEALSAAETMGLTERVLDSLDASFPAHRLRELAMYLIERNREHAKRRAHELSEVSETLRSIGFEPAVAEGGYRRLARAAEVLENLPDRPKDAKAWLQALADAETKRHAENGS